MRCSPRCSPLTPSLSFCPFPFFSLAWKYRNSLRRRAKIKSENKMQAMYYFLKIADQGGSCCQSVSLSYVTVQYSTVSQSIVRYSTVQSVSPYVLLVRYSQSVCQSIVRYSTVQYSTVQSVSQYVLLEQYSTVQYSTVQSVSLQYVTVQYSTVQHLYLSLSPSLLLSSRLQCPNIINFFCSLR